MWASVRCHIHLSLSLLLCFIQQLPRGVMTLGGRGKARGMDLPRFVYIILTLLKCPDRTIRTLQAHPSKPVPLADAFTEPSHRKRNARSIALFVQLGVFRCVLRQEETDSS